MPSENDTFSSILPGTLELLILRTLSLGNLHGYGIAQHIQRLSKEALHVGEGSLYPALQRMQLKGWVTSKWSQSSTGRRVRHYSLTTAGRRQLGVEIAEFDRMVRAITRVLQTE
jgi:PadR family transcriptional regulator PadR